VHCTAQLSCCPSVPLQLPHLKELRFTSGQALPDALAGLLPPGCTFSTAGVPREGPGTDCWGRSLHQTAPVSDSRDSRCKGKGLLQHSHSFILRSQLYAGWRLCSCRHCLLLLALQLHMDWCESLLTTAGLNLEAIEAGPDAALMRQISRQIVS